MSRPRLSCRRTERGPSRLVVDQRVRSIGRDGHRVAQTVDDPCAVVILNGLRAVASGTVDDVERTGIGQFMSLGLLPRVGVVKYSCTECMAMATTSAPCSRAASSLWPRLCRCRPGWFGSPDSRRRSTPIIIGSLRVQGHGTGDHDLPPPVGESMTSGLASLLRSCRSRSGRCPGRGYPTGARCHPRLDPRNDSTHACMRDTPPWGCVGDLRGNAEHRYPV